MSRNRSDRTYAAATPQQPTPPPRRASTSDHTPPLLRRVSSRLAEKREAEGLSPRSRTPPRQTAVGAGEPATVPPPVHWSVFEHLSVADMRRWAQFMESVPRFLRDGDMADIYARVHALQEREELGLPPKETYAEMKARGSKADSWLESDSGMSRNAPVDVMCCRHCALADDTDGIAFYRMRGTTLYIGAPCLDDICRGIPALSVVALDDYGVENLAFR